MQGCGPDGVFHIRKRKDFIKACKLLFLSQLKVNIMEEENQTGRVEAEIEKTPVEEPEEETETTEETTEPEEGTETTEETTEPEEETKEIIPKSREKDPFKDIMREKEAGKTEMRSDQQKAQEKMAEVRDRLMTLKWDYEHGQINPAKRDLYEKLKKEYEDLERVAKGVE